MGGLTRTLPSVSGWFWYWNGDVNSYPIVLRVLKSDDKRGCFLPNGIGGKVGVVYCGDIGGWWKQIAEPVVPLETLDKPCPICEKEECIPREDWCASCCEDFYENVQG